MDSRVAGRMRSTILVLFLISGFSGLVYEVVWTRMLTLVLGSTVLSVSTVLAAFMAGLALGSYGFGRWIDRHDRSALRVYGCLVLGIGVFALGLPFILKMSGVFYIWIWRRYETATVFLNLLRFLLSFSTLLIPTTLMGGTLPVLSKHLIRRLEVRGRETGMLYGTNTVGAVIGCFCAGFILIGRIGIRETTLLAAGLNGFVAVVSFWLNSRASRLQLAEAPAKPSVAKRRMFSGEIPGGAVNLVLLTFALSGFAALALEVLWMRSLLYFTSIDSYAFSAMLTAFLTGLALGSLIISRFADRRLNLLVVFGLVELTIGLSALLSLPIFSHLYHSAGGIAAWLGIESWAGELSLKLVKSFFVMLVPTTLMGMTFPLVSTIYLRNRQSVGTSIGRISCLNTVGAILGSLVAGFLLIPLLGLQRGIVAVVSINIFFGAAVMMCGTGVWRLRTLKWGVLIVLLLGLGAWNRGFSGKPMILSSHFFKDPDLTYRLLYWDEGIDGSLAVLERPNGVRELNINGVSTAFTGYVDMQVHKALAHFPLLLQEGSGDVLVVGFGMGATAWSALQHPVNQVDCVEIVPDEKKTTKYFLRENKGVLDNPRFRFIEGDGRNYLLSTPKRYHMISFNAIHPKFSSNLYTEDFYRICKGRLTENGAICAWMTQNSLLEEEFKMLIRTFQSQFPHSSLWWVNPQHFVLIGTREKLSVDLIEFEGKLEDPKIREDLGETNLDHPFEILGRFLMGEERLREYCAGVGLNTDNRPLVEFGPLVKCDEEKVAKELLDLREDVSKVLVNWGADEKESRGKKEELGRYVRCSEHTMRGEIIYWYPREDEKAEWEYRRALELCPQSQHVRRLLGISRVVKEDALRVLEREPSNALALARLGRIYQEDGELDEAISKLTRAIELAPGFATPHFDLGRAYEKKGLYEQAVSEYRQAIQFWPPFPGARAYYRLAVVYSIQGMAEEAKAAFEKALAIDPSFRRLENPLK